MTELRINRPLLMRAIWVFMLAISAFNLGRYSVEFSGRLAAWLTIIGGTMALVASAGLLTFVTVLTPTDTK